MTHERDGGERVEVVRDLRHPDRREAGLLGRLARRRRACRPCRGTGPARGRSSGRSARRSPSPVSASRPTLTSGRGERQCHSRFPRACLRSFRRPTILSGTAGEGNRATCRRRHRRRIGDGARGRAGISPSAGTGSRCSTSTATPPARAAEALGTGAPARARHPGRRHRPRRRRRRPSHEVRSELGPIEIMVTSAGIDEFCPFTDITARRVGAHARGQPHRDVPLPPGRGPRHARGGLGPHRDDLVVERAVGCGADGALRRVEGRRHRPHQGAGGRVRAARHHGEHDPARIHRHADGPPRRGAR